MKTEEINNEFNKLYQQLLDYVNSIIRFSGYLMQRKPKQVEACI